MNKSKSFKTILAILCLALWNAPEAHSITPATDYIKLSESVPLETVYGSKYTERTANTWLSAIKSAKHSLDIEVFYIISKPGTQMETVIDAIKDAAKRGVNVRIIVDSVFYEKMPEYPDMLGKLKNIEVRVIPFNKLKGGVMHAKFFMVDEKKTFVGSQNFDWRSLEHIHEIGVLVAQKRMAQTFLEVFNRDWQFAKDCAGKTCSYPLYKTMRFTPVSYTNPLRMKFNKENILLYPAFSPRNFTPFNMNVEIWQIINAIKTAKKSLSVQVMTYSDHTYDGKEWKRLEKLLLSAADRGVKIRLLFANWTLKKGIEKTFENFVKNKNIEIKISTIPKHSSGPIEFARVEHCKYLVADDNLSIISTSNWSYDYFYNSRNASIVFESKKVAEALLEVFDKAWNGPYVKVFK
jgi:phosphatidylserine/phosphatidylglycerophosphate/cardiolipin synthase-like enzyme